MYESEARALPAQRDSGQVPAAVARLEGALNSVHDQVAKLTARLQPVMTPGDAIEKANDATLSPRSVRGELAERLLALAEKLAAIGAQVDSVHRRLEL